MCILSCGHVPHVPPLMWARACARGTCRCASARPASHLHLTCISPASHLHLGCISAASRQVRLGEAFLAKQSKIKELVASWAKGGKGEITKMDFRKHVRKVVTRGSSTPID